MRLLSSPAVLIAFLQVTLTAAEWSGRFSLEPRQGLTTFKACNTGVCSDCWGEGYDTCAGTACVNTGSGQRCCADGSVCTGGKKCCGSVGVGEVGGSVAGTATGSMGSAPSATPSDSGNDQWECSDSDSLDQCCQRGGDTGLRWCSGAISKDSTLVCYKPAHSDECCEDGTACYVAGCCAGQGKKTITPDQTKATATPSLPATVSPALHTVSRADLPPSSTAGPDAGNANAAPATDNGTPPAGNSTKKTKTVGAVVGGVLGGVAIILLILLRIMFVMRKSRKEHGGRESISSNEPVIGGGAAAALAEQKRDQSRVSEQQPRPSHSDDKGGEISVAITPMRRVSADHMSEKQVVMRDDDDNQTIYTTHTVDSPQVNPEGPLSTPHAMPSMPAGQQHQPRQLHDPPYQHPHPHQQPHYEQPPDVQAWMAQHPPPSHPPPQWHFQGHNPHRQSAQSTRSMQSMPGQFNLPQTTYQPPFAPNHRSSAPDAMAMAFPPSPSQTNFTSLSRPQTAYSHAPSLSYSYSSPPSPIVMQQAQLVQVASPVVRKMRSASTLDNNRDVQGQMQGQQQIPMGLGVSHHEGLHQQHQQQQQQYHELDSGAEQQQKSIPLTALPPMQPQPQAPLQAPIPASQAQSQPKPASQPPQSAPPAPPAQQSQPTTAPAQAQAQTLVQAPVPVKAVEQPSPLPTSESKPENPFENAEISNVSTPAPSQPPTPTPEPLQPRRYQPNMLYEGC